MRRTKKEKDALRFQAGRYAYKELLRAIDWLMIADPEKTTPEGRLLSKVAEAVEQYEKKTSLYEIAKDITIKAGFPWTDPRSGKTHEPIRRTADKAKARKRTATTQRGLRSRGG